MILKYISLIFILFFIGCGESSSSHEYKPQPLQLLVPLYSLPSDTQDNVENIWDKVALASTKIPVCVIFGVIRGHNEPVGTPTQEYIDGLKKLRDADAKILAYVETNNARRDIQEIKTDVEAYAENFDIDGIFFDETSGNIRDTDYYNEITQYSKSFESVHEVMLNSPGVEKEFILASDADTFLVFENAYEYWNDFDSKKYDGVNLEKLNIIVHTVPNTQAMQTVIDEANQQRITNLYITDKEFDLLPSFFNDEVLTIENNNAKLD